MIIKWLAAHPHIAEHKPAAAAAASAASAASASASGRRFRCWFCRVLAHCVGQAVAELVDHAANASVVSRDVADRQQSAEPGAADAEPAWLLFRPPGGSEKAAKVQ